MSRRNGSIPTILCLLVLSLLVFGVTATRAQQSDSEASPNPKENSPKATKSPDSVPAPKPSPTASPDAETIWTREDLTGDWGGVRKEWEDRGVSFELSWTNFFQGTASGGLETDFAYGGKLTGILNLDTTKLGWWKYGKFQVKVDNRYHDSASELTGAVVPVNSALLGPKGDGTATSVTALNYTHIFPFAKPGDMALVAVGRFDMLDGVTEPLIGGAGETKFMNLNFVAPPHEARNIPLVTWGAFWVWVKQGEPFLSIGFFDSADSSSTTGIPNMFEKGITVMPAITKVTHFGGKAGHQGLRATWSNQTTTPFEQLRHLILPLPNRPVESKTGTWSVTYSFDQYLHEIPGFPRKGWGIFGQLGFADRRTNPIQTFVNIGIGGNSPFKSRPRDNFGVAYAFDSISGDLKDALDPLERLRDGHAFEAFYNFALTPWLYLTGDAQIIRPARPRTETAFVPGLRMRVLF